MCVCVCVCVCVCRMGPWFRIGCRLWRLDCIKAVSYVHVGCSERERERQKERETKNETENRDWLPVSKYL